RCAEQGRGAPPDRGAGAAQGIGAGRTRGRQQAGALDAARGAGGKPAGRRGRWPGAHPLAVRSACYPAQAHRIVLRLRPPLRGLCAEGEAPVRLFCASGPGRQRHRRRHRSEDRPPEQETSDAEMELGRQGGGAGRAQGLQAPHRGSAASFRAISAGGVGVPSRNSTPPGLLAPCCTAAGANMAKDKSILEKFTDAVKDIASTATEAASQALKTDEPALRVDERAAAYVPLAAD